MGKAKGKREIHLDVTPEDYSEQLARGINKDAALKPGRHTFKRGGFRDRHPDFSAKTAEKKVRVTIWLDSDIVNYFKERAAEPNAAPYQTQINSVLRDALQQTNTSEVMRLLNDETFISAVAEKVKDKATQ